MGGHSGWPCVTAVLIRVSPGTYLYHLVTSSNMKFAHEFNSALIKEGFPPHWVESAVPYRQLKKCIKNVESELRGLGFDSATLAQLIPGLDQEGHTIRRSSSIAFQYHFDGVYLKLSLFPSYSIHRLISS